MEAVLAGGSTIGMEGLGRTTLVLESDWLPIKEYDTEDMKPILLSYDHCPSYLKRCFSYFSIFPKGYVIKRETLVQLWIAEGFIIPDERGTRSKEDIGNEYFESLLSCKFLVGVEKNEVGDINTCTMHDHVHDLAQALVGDNECISLKVRDLTGVSEIQRLRLTLDEELLPTSALSKAKNLRTVIILQSSKNLDLQSFRSNDQLRVLYLHGLGAHLSELSNWSGEFKQLRYLNLTSFDLSKVKYDKSLYELYYLETLVLRECRNIINVLWNVGSLQNLSNLDLSYTAIDKIPDFVTSLCNLQRLDLNNCFFLTRFPNSITGLKYLKYLNMSCTPIEKIPGFISTLHNLQILDVHNCPKLKSLNESVEGLDNLRVFIFTDCPQLEVLPQDFGSLTQLRYLNVTGCNVKVLPESCDKLSNLEIVDLSDCELPKEVTNWKKLRIFTHAQQPETPEGIRELDRLESLVYSVTKDHGLEEVGNLELLDTLVISHLRFMGLHDIKDAERANLKGKRNLRTLTLDWNVSINCKVAEALQPPTCLKRLVILSFMGWLLPLWLCDPSCLPNLETLELIGCDRMKKIPEDIGNNLPSLRFLNLRRLPLKRLNMKISSLTDLQLVDMLFLEELRGFFPRLETLTIDNCSMLAKGRVFDSLRMLLLMNIDYKMVSLIAGSQSTLTSLMLENIEGLVFFPMIILRNNSNLQQMTIEKCNMFQGFEANNDEEEASPIASDLYNGCLQTLNLTDCPVLQFLPDSHRWASMPAIYITRCPLVQSSSR